jgi:ATP-dependent Clp protease protease subunit
MIRRDADTIQNYFDYGIDIDNRRIFLMDELTVDSVTIVTQSLFLMDSIKKSTISLVIDSNGGDTIQMYKLVDAMNAISSKVETIVLGRAFSAAPIIAASGARGMRYATPNACFMVHQASLSHLTGKLSEVRAEIDLEAFLDEKWYSIMSKLTKLSRAQWRDLCEKNKDHYFDADTAIEYGIIDEIWTQKI